MNLYIKRIPEKKANLIILPESMLRVGEIIPRRMILHAGMWKYEVEVEFRNDLPENTIGFSSTLKIPYDLPEQLPYEVKIKDRNLYIGPIIAFLAFTETKDITSESLNEYLGNFSSYSDIQGLIYICAANGIDAFNQTSEGYYYDPAANEDEPTFKYGKFPYPNVVFCKIDINRPEYDQMIAAFGQNMFNTYLSDKWELGEWLSPYTFLREHLPYTDLLNNVQDLEDMLCKYEAVYIKPIETGEGKRLLKVSKTSEGYCLVDKLSEKICFSSSVEAGEFLSVLLSNEAYVVQQAVSTKNYEDRIIIFRVIMQKNSSKRWACSYIIACFGEIGSISANYNRSGIVLTGRETLRKVFRMNEREVFLKEQEMIDLCQAACKTLEHSGGNYAELCIEIILDENLKLWIIEINHLLDHKLLLYSDRQLYLKVNAIPLEYAKSFAGFS